jgi:hypothetical protein
VFLDRPSLIARLDPRNIFRYVSDSESSERYPTVFRIKPLTIKQFSETRGFLIDDVDEVRSSRYNLAVVKEGLVGWENFKDSKGDDIQFSIANINFLPNLDIIDELASAILLLSDVDNEIELNIRLSVKWSNYLGKISNPGQWSCEECMTKNMASNRNCDGTALRRCRFCKEDRKEENCPECGKLTTPKFILRFNNKLTKYATENIDYVTRCPVAIIKPGIVNMMNLVSFADDSKALPVPGAAFEQSNFYLTVRNLLQEERAKSMDDDTKAPPRTDKAPENVKQSVGKSFSRRPIPLRRGAVK